jgi:copper binding plastocyanin/azurin family protein
MKRVLVAVALGGLLMVGTPTLASSAQRNDTRAEKGDNADKGGDKGGRGEKGEKGDNGGRGDNGRRGDNRGDGRDHDRDGHRYGYGYGYGYPYYGGYYGEPYDCYYGRSGAYNCEPYGGDSYPGYGDGYGGSYGGSRDGNVLIRGMAFNPPETRIRPGDDVTWMFSDREAHTVTADNKSFDSGKRKDGEFRLRFGQPGSYSYHCAVHPDMKGRVLVG